MTAPSTLADVGSLLAMPALTLGEAVRRGEVTPTELVEASLARIEEVEGGLAAFVTVDQDGALEQARLVEGELARGVDRGPLHGVPIAIKDLTPTRGLRTTFGSRAFAEFIPETDAASVANIRAAGMIIVGKTSLCEFGALPVTESGLTGSCRNPWDTSQNAGGSSGGSACALAAGMVPLAHGTDGGGSVRIPAAHCGAFGLKPSRGRISLAPRAGERLTGWATEGAIARTVQDAAALLDVMSSYELGDPYWQTPPRGPFQAEATAEPKRLRIGFALESPDGVSVESEVSNSVVEVARTLEALGHDVTEAAPRWHSEAGEDDVKLVWATLTAYYELSDLSLVDESTRASALAGAATSALDYVRATMRNQRLARQVAGFWGAHDILLTPVTPKASVANAENPEAVGAEHVHGLTSFTRWANLTGQPAAAVPVSQSSAGIPLAVQLMGGPGADAELIQLCGQLQAASPGVFNR